MLNVLDYSAAADCESEAAGRNSVETNGTWRLLSMRGAVNTLRGPFLSTEELGQKGFA